MSQPGRNAKSPPEDRASTSPKHAPWILAGLSAVVVAIIVWQLVKPDGQPLPPRETPLHETVISSARGLIRDGSYSQARELMTSYVETHPNDVHVRPLLVETKIHLADRMKPEQRRAELIEAELITNELIKASPGAPRAWWLKGELVYRRGEDPEKYFRKAATSADPTPQIKSNFGLFLLSRGEFAEAGKWLAEARRDGADDAGTLYGLGQLALADGEDARAVELLRASVDAEPGRAEAWILLVEAMKNAGRIDHALAALERAMERHEDARLKMQLGEVELMKGRRERAAEAFARAADALSEQPESKELEVKAAFSAARCYHWLGERDNAIKYIDQAAELQPENLELAHWQLLIESTATRPAGS